METKRSLAGKEYLIGVAENQASPGDVTSSAVPTSAGPNFGTNSWGQTYGIASAIGKSSPLTMGLLLQINGNTNLSGLTGYNPLRYTHLFAYFLSRGAEPLVTTAFGLRRVSGATARRLTPPS